MAISILHTTAANLTQASFALSIPATTAGSTLIVSCNYVTAAGAGGNSINNITDDEGSVLDYPSVFNVNRNDSGQVRGVKMAYRVDCPAGITTVYVVPNDSDGMSMFTVVYEVSGINTTSPLVGSNTRNFNDTGSSSSGTNLTTPYSNTLFVGLGIRTSAGSTSAGGGFSQSQATNAGSTSGAQGTLITSGSATFVLNHPFQTAGNMIGIAAFNPTANTYTLNLSETISLADTLGDETDYQRSLSDSVTLSDFVDFILSTNSYFRTLFETIVLADTLTTSLSAFRTLVEGVTLTDSISFVKNTQRTFTEEIRLQDWLGVKKNSKPWSS